MVNIKTESCNVSNRREVVPTARLSEQVTLGTNSNARKIGCIHNAFSFLKSRGLASEVPFITHLLQTA